MTLKYSARGIYWNTWHDVVLRDWNNNNVNNNNNKSCIAKFVGLSFKDFESFLRNMESSTRPCQGWSSAVTANDDLYLILIVSRHETKFTKLLN